MYRNSNENNDSDEDLIQSYKDIRNNNQQRGYMDGTEADEDIELKYLMDGLTDKVTMVNDQEFQNQHQEQAKTSGTISNKDVIILMEAAVNGALEYQQKIFSDKLKEVENRQRINEGGPLVVYEQIPHNSAIPCNEPLDLVKSIPSFDGKQDEYVAWRTAVVNAYEIYKPYLDNSRAYQAVGIIRNKVIGPAGVMLTSHNTVLNFDAIIARMDCAYAEQTPIEVTQQQMVTMRQGELPLMSFYNEIERKLTLIISKTLLSYDTNTAAILNNRSRQEALTAFVSGLKKSVRHVVLSAAPKDLPSALAVAQRAESCNERAWFVASFNKNLEEKSCNSENRRQCNRFHNTPQGNNHNNSQEAFQRNQNNNAPGISNQAKGSQFFKNQGHKSQMPQNNESSNSRKGYTQNLGPEPMDVDPTSRSKFKGEQTARSRQRLNHTTQEQSNDQEYRVKSSYEAAAIEADNTSDSESCNFLGDRPCSSLRT